MTCRRAGPADEVQLAAMAHDFYAEERLPYGPANAAALRVLLADAAQGEVHLIEARGMEPRTAGFFVLTWCYSVERGGKMALLDELYVVPQARGRGAGQAALAAAADLARAAGCRGMLLEVDHVNDRARRLYLRAGFAALARDSMCLLLD